MTAARRLQSAPDEITMGELLLALEREPVQQIREQLSKVMRAKTEAESTPNNFVEKRNIHAESSADQDVEVLMHLSELIQHELAPSLGFLELAAMDEIDNFDGSKTSRELASLRQRIGGVSRLMSAHRPLVEDSVDLDDLMNGITKSIDIAEITFIKNLGSRNQASIVTDSGLLELLLSNAFRNAKEALDRLPGTRRSIEITYSVDSSGYWISIVNPFHGNEFSIDEVDRAGLSTKGLQRGYGVRIMKLISSRLSISFGLRGSNGIAQLIIEKRS